MGHILEAGGSSFDKGTKYQIPIKTQTVWEVQCIQFHHVILLKHFIGGDSNP